MGKSQRLPQSCVTLLVPKFSIFPGIARFSEGCGKLLPNVRGAQAVWEQRCWGAPLLREGCTAPGLLSLVLGSPFLYHGNVATNQLKWQYDDKLV